VAEAKKESKKGKQEAQNSDSSGAVEFLKGTKEELDKVVWPSRQQLASESVAVILMVTLSAALIYLVDSFFGWAAAQIFNSSQVL
jgi:preprotein translocase subunit SecE